MVPQLLSEWVQNLMPKKKDVYGLMGIQALKLGGMHRIFKCMFSVSSLVRQVSRVTGTEIWLMFSLGVGLF